MSLTLNNNIATMKPGDYVWCKYIADSNSVGIFSDFATKTDLDVGTNILPVLSITNPNGYFKFICVGYDIKDRLKLVADRNIQGNISWDTLNTNGIVSEKNIYFNVIPIITSNTGEALASSEYSNGFYPAWKAFNKSNSSEQDAWLTLDGTSNGWLRYKFLTSKIINRYAVTNEQSSTTSAGSAPKNWTFEGSNDGTNWTILDTQTNQINWTNSQRKEYLFNNTIAYLYYRINISTNNGGRWLGIGELEMFESNNIISSMRLLTGGISSTDTTNEWDQIIVNSTLNNTITAGDNNIWNWKYSDASATKSWTSTTQSVNSTRVLRAGGNPVLITSNMTTNSSGIGSGYGFRPVLLIKPLAMPIFIGNLLSSSIHNQDTILTGSISNADSSTNKIQYKILVNDTQIYPISEYTDLVTSPIAINYTISNSLLTNINNKITIAMNNEINKTNIQDYYVTLYNNMPNGVLSLSNTTTHADNIELTGNISDVDLDKISYRILINDIEMLPWSGFINDPYIDYTILNKDLNIGDNIIKVEYKDNYKSIGLGNWMNSITKTNNTSIINCRYINGSIIGTITDPDSDLTQYRILINNKQVYPLNNYTEFEQVNNIDYQINRNDILIGKDNIATIVAQDNFGGYITQDIAFIGDYIGLMFMDQDQQFYTTDIGELLKYLDFGTITLGQITEPVKILVQNKYGFKIKDINLYITNTMPNVSIELSKEENPFIATDNLTLEDTYNPNEIDYFYVRLNSSISSNSVSGEFKIYAKATPLSE
jgi:hypothetical protein